MHVLVCLLSSTLVNGVENVVSSDCSMYFVVATGAPKVFTVFFFILLRVPHGVTFRRVEAGEDQRV